MPKYFATSSPSINIGVFALALTLLSPLAAQALSISDLTGSGQGGAGVAVDLRLTSIAKANFPGGFTATPLGPAGGFWSYNFSWSRAYPNRNGYIYVSQKQSDNLYHIVAAFTNLTGAGTVTSDTVFAPSTAYRLSYYSKPYGSHTTDYVILRSIWTTPDASGASSSSGNTGGNMATACPSGFHAVPPPEPSAKNINHLGMYTTNNDPLKYTAYWSNAVIQTIYGPNISACTPDLDTAKLRSDDGRGNPIRPWADCPAGETSFASNYIGQSVPAGFGTCVSTDKHEILNPACPSGWKLGQPLINQAGTTMMSYCIPQSAQLLSQSDPANYPTSCPAGFSQVDATHWKGIPNFSVTDPNGLVMTDIGAGVGQKAPLAYGSFITACIPTPAKTDCSNADYIKACGDFYKAEEAGTQVAGDIPPSCRAFESSAAGLTVAASISACRPASPVVCPAGWKRNEDPGLIGATTNSSGQIVYGNISGGATTMQYCVPQSAKLLAKIANSSYVYNPGTYCPAGGVGMNGAGLYIANPDVGAVEAAYGQGLDANGVQTPQICKMTSGYEQCPAGWMWPKAASWPAGDNFELHYPLSTLDLSKIQASLNPGQSITGPNGGPITGPVYSVGNIKGKIVSGVIPTPAQLSDMNDASKNVLNFGNGDYLQLCIPSTAVAH